MMNTKTLPTIGFIGTGIMGKSMALHILKAGYPVNVFNRSKEKTIPLIEQGAVWHSSPREVAAHSDIIITIIGYPKDVEEVYLGKEGILMGAQSGSIAIDMTTSSPTLATRIAKEGLAKQIDVLDAPVSGGDIGARDARLSIMVGGNTKAFESACQALQSNCDCFYHHGGMRGDSVCPRVGLRCHCGIKSYWQWCRWWHTA